MVLHQVQAWNAAKGIQIYPDRDCAISLYEKFGYIPGDPATDQGAVELDVVQYWMKIGVAVTDMGAIDKLDGYAVVNQGDSQRIKQCIDVFGGVLLGLAMPISAQRQMVWDVVSTPNGAPGSWGGHAVPIIAYDDVGPYCISWGEIIQMTWTFLAQYADEAYAPLSIDRLARNGSWSALVQQIKDLSGTIDYGNS